MGVLPIRAFISLLLSGCNTMKIREYLGRGALCARLLITRNEGHMAVKRTTQPKTLSTPSTPSSAPARIQKDTRPAVRRPAAAAATGETTHTPKSAAAGRSGRHAAAIRAPRAARALKFDAPSVAPAPVGPQAVTEEDIRVRAYFLALEHRGHGRSVDFWLLAERELRSNAAPRD